MTEDQIKQYEELRTDKECIENLIDVMKGDLSDVQNPPKNSEWCDIIHKYKDAIINEIEARIIYAEVELGKIDKKIREI